MDGIKPRTGIELFGAFATGAILIAVCVGLHLVLSKQKRLSIVVLDAPPAKVAALRHVARQSPGAQKLLAEAETDGRVTVGEYLEIARQID